MPSYSWVARPKWHAQDVPRAVACAGNASASDEVSDVSMAATAPWRLLQPVRKNQVMGDAYKVGMLQGGGYTVVWLSPLRMWTTSCFLGGGVPSTTVAVGLASDGSRGKMRRVTTSRRLLKASRSTPTASHSDR